MGLMLPSLTTAFLLGLFCSSQISFFPISMIGLLAALAIGLSLLERADIVDSRQALFLYGALLAGVLYWSVATPSSHPQRALSDPIRGSYSEVTGRIVSPVRHGPGRQTILLRMDGPLSESSLVRVVWRDPDEILLQGDRVSFRARIHRPRGSLNPGGFDYATYLERQGVDFVATVAGTDAVVVLESGRETWRWAVWNRIDRWRVMIQEAAIHTLSQPALGIFLGIIIGERGFIQQELEEWFMTTGTVHLLSISGSHLGLVALVMFWSVKQTVLRLPAVILLEMSRRITPSRVAILITWPAVAFYAWLAGAELATMRSLAMITLALVTLWLGYERRMHHAIAVAALLIVAHDPRAVFDISFQLSFLSVFTMIQTADWLRQWNGETASTGGSIVSTVAAYSRDAVVMSGAVTLATLPIVALYFNQVPWMGLVTNLAAIPFTGFILVPAGLLASLWTVLTGSGDLSMGYGLELLLTWMVQALRWCAGIPGGEWHIAAPSLPMIMLFYCGLVALGLSVSPHWVRRGAGTLILVIVCWWVWSPRVGGDGDRWRVTFLDVGQGDSAVIESPDGQTVLIDGGARYERFDMGRGVVAPFLWNRGIGHLDHVVGTHQQLDHVGGLIWILRHMSVGRYWGNGVERSERFSTDLTAALNGKRVPQAIAVRGGDLLQPGPCRLRILSPWEAVPIERGGARADGTTLNNQSIVSRLECGVHAILFAADIEIDGLRRLGEDGRRPVTVVKVPHHGAKSSLDRGWIGEIHPQYAVFSVGRGNSYGHPVPAVLHAYEEERATVLRTDRDGAIWVTGRLSTSDIAVTRTRDLLPQPVDSSRRLWRSEQENWRRVWAQFLDRFV
ncbi:MAG TPA: DNA internalization-related competence protein ComEC/Rec2 [Nitrospira sp.]|nr:DNA internalization-related competence protein ComEC/Rec2 [Nitrospira sp.]